MEILEKKTCIFQISVLLYAGTCESAYAPIAQLDRVTGYEPVGRGFESLPAYHLTGYPIRDDPLNFL